MAEEEWKERIITLEGRMKGHEDLCAERYDRIIEKSNTLNKTIVSFDKKLEKLSITKLVILMSVVLGVFATIMKFTGL